MKLTKAKMQRVCLTRRKETSVVSCILGFRNDSVFLTINGKKGGTTLWRS